MREATRDLADGFHEVETVPNFASELDNRGVLRWWRTAMGYAD